MAAEAFAAAKINLTLHVTGRRDDGYHLLDSLVVFADIGDRITVTPASEWSLRVIGPMAAGVPAGDDNLVLRVARLIGGPPCAITLDKHLPMAAGIGGGSADAAAVLRALSALDGRALPGDLAGFGADLPICLQSLASRMRGIGDLIDPIPGLPPLYGVLANPGVPLSTQEVFTHLHDRSSPPMPEQLPDWPDATTFARWLGVQRNDLEPAARAIAPVIGVVLSRLSATPGCLLARMSGSGATCFALYETAHEAEGAAANLRTVHPGWWIAAARFGSAPA